MATTRHLTGRDEFLDLVLADDEFVRAEFEAIIAGFDDPPPRRPARPGPPSRRAARTADEAPLPRAHRPVTPERARQRAPPTTHAVPAAGPLANTQPTRPRSRTTRRGAYREPAGSRRTGRFRPRAGAVPSPFPHTGAAMPDPHEVLGVPEDATQEEITAAYRRLARRHHPDTAEDGEPARFREVAAAYAALRAQRPRAQLSEPALRVGPVRYHGPPRR